MSYVTFRLTGFNSTVLPFEFLPDATVYAPG